MLTSRSAVADGFNFQVYPNLASAASTIAYTVPAGAYLVKLQIGDQLAGRKLVVQQPCFKPCPMGGSNVEPPFFWWLMHDFLQYPNDNYVCPN